MKHKGTTLNQAKALRKNMTQQEFKLWQILRNNAFYGLKFRRQVPIGNYVVDFLCESEHLIIEIDGGQHNCPENINADIIRSEYLKGLGYKVIRFWNNDIDKNMSGVYDAIKQHFNIID